MVSAIASELTAERRFEPTAERNDRGCSGRVAIWKFDKPRRVFVTSICSCVSIQPVNYHSRTSGLDG